jgi:hypothetical protein
MKARISLPDVVLEQAKQQAEREGLTLDELIERALRSTLLRRVPEQEEHFRLVTYGSGGRRPGNSSDSLKDILDAEDVERLGAGLANRLEDSDDLARRR